MTHQLPRFITHANLVLISKKGEGKTPNKFETYQLINFVNKMFSRMILERLSKDIPKIISNNQSGFVKGRSIAENFLLAQKIIRDINKRSKQHNVVVKLDITKAYERVSWVFLTKVLKKFGFSEIVIDITWRLLSNSWYSILINRKAHIFFESTKGVKQGDPISPTVFIIGPDVLSKGLSNLFKDSRYIGYGLSKWSPNVNYPAYVDDTILFGSGDKCSIIRMMKVISEYEKVSGQMVNKNKSFSMFMRIARLLLPSN